MSSDAPSSDDPARVSGRKVFAVFAALFLLVLALSVTAAVVVPRAIERQKLANRVGCSNRIQGLALAGLQYANDKRGFPHVQGASELDGDPSTPDTPRVMRRLLGYGYLDAPEQLICPVRPRLVSSKAERAARGEWLRTPPGQRSPHASPSLEAFEQLSYGWVRRALSPNAPGTTLLAADKAVFAPRGSQKGLRGNHTDGWTVVRVDGSSAWLSVHDTPFPGERLHRTEDPKRDGFLCVKDQSDPSLWR